MERFNVRQHITYHMDINPSSEMRIANQNTRNAIKVIVTQDLQNEIKVASPVAKLRQSSGKASSVHTDFISHA